MRSGQPLDSFDAPPHHDRERRAELRRRIPNDGWSSFIASSDNGSRHARDGQRHSTTSTAAAPTPLQLLRQRSLWTCRRHDERQRDDRVRLPAAAHGSKGAYVSLHSASVTLQDNGSPT